MKKLLAILTSACMLFASSFTSLAATAEKLSPIPCPGGFAGGTLSIEISAQFENLSGVHLTFKYDHSKLRYTGQETAIGHGDAAEDDETLEWSTMLAPEGQKVSRGDVIATLNFDIISEMTNGEKYIEFGVAEAYDANMEDLDFYKNGHLTLKSETTLGIMGDHDKDGFVTSSDALSILRASISDPDAMDTITKELSDCNMDSIIDSSDALDALRYSTELPTESKYTGNYREFRYVHILELRNYAN